MNHTPEQCTACNARLNQGDQFVLAVLGNAPTHICVPCWDGISLPEQPPKHAWLRVPRSSRA